MTNEDIITALKNAIISGESLESAMQIMVNSGYDPREVREASRFVSQGVISDLNPSMVPNVKPSEVTSPKNQQYQQLSSQNPQQQLSKQQLPQTDNQTDQQTEQQITKIQQPVIKRKSHTKEIILVLILIFLMGVLATTVYFKDVILGYFS